MKSLSFILFLLSSWILALIWLFAPADLSGHGTLHAKLARLNQRIAEEPENPELLVLRGELYRQHGDWDAALADYDHAESLGADHRALRFNRGLVCYARRDFQKAFVHLNAYVRYDSKNSEGWIYLARTAREMGEPERAVICYDTALSMLTSPPADILLERTAVQAGRGGTYLPEALAVLDAAMRRWGEAVTLQLAAIDLEVRIGEYDSALARITKCAQRSGRAERWLKRAGDVYSTAGRVGEARQAYARALQSLSTLPVRRQEMPAMMRLRDELESQVDMLAIQEAQ